MKKKTAILKATLEPETKRKIEDLARETVGSERGFLVRFFEKLARERIVFLNDNLKAFTSVFTITPKKGFPIITFIFLESLRRSVGSFLCRFRPTETFIKNVIQ